MRLVILNHDADGFRQEIPLRDLNLELKNLKSAEIVEAVESAQAATATLYNTWQDIKVAEVTPQRRLSDFLSSASTQREKLSSEKAKKRARERAAVKLYFKQGEWRVSDYWTKLMWGK